MSRLTCRFYRGKYPKVSYVLHVNKSKSLTSNFHYQLGQVVMIKVRNITGTAAVIKLLEYSNMEIMVDFPELLPACGSKKPLTLTSGKVTQAVVRHVDKMGNISLSITGISVYDKKKCTELYSKNLHFRWSRSKPKLNVLVTNTLALMPSRRL